MEEEKNLKESIKDIEDKLNLILPQEKEAKKKEFKIPRRAKVKGSKIKNNWVTVMKLNENGSYAWEKQPIKDQTVIVDGLPRIATADKVFMDKKTSRDPLIILPSWSVEPISKASLLKAVDEDGGNTVGYRLLLEVMKREVLAAKKKMNIALIIGGVILLAVIGYVAFKGGI